MKYKRVLKTFEHSGQVVYTKKNLIVNIIITVPQCANYPPFQKTITSVTNLQTMATLSHTGQSKRKIN